MLKKIEVELANLHNIKKEIEKVLKNAPEGKLRCAINKGCYQYYLGKQYLGIEKREYVKQIAQKEYCQKLNSVVRKYEKTLMQLNDLYMKENLETIYNELHPARRKLVKPLIKPVKEIIEEFENIEHVGKPFDENDMTEYYTIKGERVRSKSEKIIADELYRYEIPYKYEMPLELTNWNKSIVIYPDFTVLNKSTGKKWILEHLGMMDNAMYYENAMFKLDTYEKNDILLGKNLILLHETSSSPLNTNVVKKYIENYLC